jgi:hypothetical protein
MATRKWPKWSMAMEARIWPVGIRATVVAPRSGAVRTTEANT